MRWSGRQIRSFSVWSGRKTWHGVTWSWGQLWDNKGGLAAFILVFSGFLVFAYFSKTETANISEYISWKNVLWLLGGSILLATAAAALIYMGSNRSTNGGTKPRLLGVITGFFGGIRNLVSTFYNVGSGVPEQFKKSSFFLPFLICGIWFVIVWGPLRRIGHGEYFEWLWGDQWLFWLIPLSAILLVITRKFGRTSAILFAVALLIAMSCFTIDSYYKTPMGQSRIVARQLAKVQRAAELKMNSGVEEKTITLTKGVWVTERVRPGNKMTWGRVDTNTAVWVKIDGGTPFKVGPGKVSYIPHGDFRVIGFMSDLDQPVEIETTSSPITQRS